MALVLVLSVFSCICPYCSSGPSSLWALSIELCLLSLVLSPFLLAELFLILKSKLGLPRGLILGLGGGLREPGL